MKKPPSGRPALPPLPPRISPMLAKSSEPFDSEDHLFEVKWDGTRCIVFAEPKALRLQNRRFVEMGPRYPELACLRDLPPGTVLDGEIVVLEGGKPSFEKLQQRDHLEDPRRIDLLVSRLPCTLMAFDLLYEDGRSIMRLPLTERRRRLSQVVQKLGSAHVLAPDHVARHGVRYFAEVARHGLEGIMAKRLNSPYLPGKRSDHWLKIKVPRRGSFRIIGYVPREGQRVVSALVLGMMHRRQLIYKGKVGSGFTEAQRAELFALLADLPLLDNPPKDGPQDAVWRRTDLECEVRFFEKTKTGMLRGPVFERLLP